MYLTETVLEWKCFNSKHLHLFHLFLVEELHLIHGDDTVTVQIHAAEPILHTGQVTTTCSDNSQQYIVLYCIVYRFLTWPK